MFNLCLQRKENVIGKACKDEQWIKDSEEKNVTSNTVVIDLCVS